jgi:hypothetical protein
MLAPDVADLILTNFRYVRVPDFLSRVGCSGRKTLRNKQMRAVPTYPRRKRKSSED